jgi:uncharacterized protein (TIGR01777 family)
LRILTAGGTGFVGEALVGQLLRDRHEVIVLTRDPSVYRQPEPGFSATPVRWDARGEGPWCEYLRGCGAVINLAGEPLVSKRWDSAQKDVLRQSRLGATETLVRAMERHCPAPSVLINASASGYYDLHVDGKITESHPRGDGFLQELCEAWENAAKAAESFGVRVVLLRFGVILGKDGGILKKMTPPFSFFCGGPLGDGTQWISWIHRRDVVEIIRFACLNENLSGAVNAASPSPVTMEQFCQSLGAVMGRPSWLKVSARMLRLVFGEMAEVLLSDQQLVPMKLREAGFRFRYPELDQAFRDIFKISPPADAK